MSLVSRPCRYDARSVPDTTIRPRSERSMKRRALARGVVRGRGNRRNHDAMLRHALALILSARRSRRWRSLPRVASAQQPQPQALQEAARRRTSRSSCAACRSAPSRSTVTRTADGWTIVEHRPARRAARRRRPRHCRCATRRTGSRSSSRSTRPSAAQAQTIRTVVDGDDRDERRRRRRTDDAEDRHDRSGRACCCCRIRSSGRSKRSPPG